MTLCDMAKRSDCCMFILIMKDGSTVLHVAVSSGNPEMVEFLLNHGADVGAVDEVFAGSS